MNNCKPITELSNGERVSMQQQQLISHNIVHLADFSNELDGKLSAHDFLKVLRACDSQIFTGWKSHSTILDEDIMETCEYVARHCSELLFTALKHPEKKIAIIMSGCGTSGRIAFLTSRRMNRLCTSAGMRPIFHYLISGGDSAVLLSDELPEDDPVEGAKDLSRLIEDSGEDGAFLIGVTCGLSAPYVAGQVKYVLEAQSTKIGAALMGFNPINLSRNAAIEKAPGKWSFRDVAMKLEMEARFNRNGSKKLAIINPIVGPEPIAGSSRMKGGSVTAVLLDAICMRSFVLLSEWIDVLALKTAVKSETIAEIILKYQNVHAMTYMRSFQNNCLPTCMEEAAASLRAGGRIFMLGADSAGCMGIIDASEMPDTYGSPFDQIRGFVQGGWSSEGVSNVTGDISDCSSLHKISFADFREDILPTLSKSDSVIIVAHSNCFTSELSFLAKEVSSLSSVFFIAAVHNGQQTQDTEEMIKSLKLLAQSSVIIQLSQSQEGYFDYSLKLMLNAISTYAQAKGRGAVLKGLMVTTGPANDKIYNRCIEIISDAAKVEYAQAEYALLQAIYKVDCIDQDILSRPRSSHIAKSILPSHMRHCSQTILPLSILLATGLWTVESADAALNEEPRVSVLLESKVMEHDVKSPVCQGAFAVLCDMGGTNLRMVIAKANCRKLTMNKILSTPIGENKSKEAITKLIQETYKKCLLQNEISVSDTPCCVVMAQPGRVNDITGSIEGLSNFPWASFPMRSILYELTKCKNIKIMEDCDAALCGEVMENEMKEDKCRTVLMITIGTGVGTSLWVNGAPYAGSRRLVEGGHLILHPGGLLCPCGQRGCLEMYSSGLAIARRASHLNHFAGMKSTVTARDVVSEANNGNADAIAILEQATQDLANGLVSMCRLCDPSLIVVGGGLGPYFFDNLVQEFNKLTWTIHEDCREIEFRRSAHEESGLSGCLAIANRCYFKDAK